ncbi:site-specific integrase [Motiliproteus sp. SC1-56]|uniref:site-specific integrase n=1 Tax=Motiliproteus sp. SC1-56 TaxID=2799565 RepID=UPI001A8CDDBE|nr:site-specific integrase [Motiliproteus sp. SC1-56]
MGKVRVRKETGNLFFDFRFLGMRCREQTALPDNAQNRKKVESMLAVMEAKMLLNQFDYGEFFPNSPNLPKVASKLAALNTYRRNPCDGGPNEAPMFSDFTETWFSELQVQWRTSHNRNVRAVIDSSLVPAFKNFPVDQVTKASILAFRAELSKRPGRNSTGVMSPKTINTHMGVLRMIMTEAADRYGFTNPYRNIKPLKLQRKHIEPFSLDEVNNILDRVRDDYRNYYTVRFYTGMRTGEVDGLKWEYVDFDSRQILVRETLVSGKTEYTKTDGSQREIPMLGPVFDALQAQYQSTGKISKYVFCNRQGEPLDHCNVTKRVWYPLLRHLRLKERRPYQTRHTAATLFLASGENPEWVARVLGHTSTEMLFRVYSRYIPNLRSMRLSPLA